eukprot:TRINITY_DN44_c0_g1_i1.p1 TRINITY_DN44_c0_g1~~TRINITY_DN44_c0_g1_i1.p1  ORF type:complete len:208 (-),score=43.39 TRINITY_DN44_c0_g1_i1:46-669(-)
MCIRDRVSTQSTWDTNLNSLGIEFRPFLSGSISRSGKIVQGGINMSLVPFIQDSIEQESTRKKMVDFKKRAMFKMSISKIISILSFKKDSPKLSLENENRDGSHQSMEMMVNEEGNVSIKIENSNSSGEKLAHEITIQSHEFITFQLMAEYLFPYMVGWNGSEALQEQIPSYDQREERKYFRNRRSFGESKQYAKNDFNKEEDLEAP